ncbi:MAG: peptide chain release factor N(5)-glutamine methyltransferase [Peptococcia bacterium]
MLKANENWTGREAFRWGISQLLKAGHSSEEARLEARFLLEKAWRKAGVQFAISLNEELDSQSLELYLFHLGRRVQGEPLEYILGQQEFLDLSFLVNQDVLIPRRDTEVLVKAALEFAGQLANPQILELCTGSGVIAVSLAYYLPTALVTAVDISAPALEVAKANSVKYGVNGRVSFYQGDLFEPLVEGFKYDLLVANPPYISEAEYETLPADVKKEPALALLAGSDGLDYYRRIASRAAQFLLREGKLFLEIGWQQGEEVSQILKEAGFDEITVIADQAGRDRVICASVGLL